MSFTEEKLKPVAMNIVNQILDETETSVETRQSINDKCDDFVLGILRETLEAQKQLIKDELEKKAFIPEFGANHHWTNGAVKYLILDQAINLIENL